jgi:hypothetical protein
MLSSYPANNTLWLIFSWSLLENSLRILKLAKLRNFDVFLLIQDLYGIFIVTLISELLNTAKINMLSLIEASMQITSFFPTDKLKI